MSKAKNGDVVKVHYTGKLEDGSVFDSSLERDPLQFTLGAGQMIKGFEAAVLGMEIGEEKVARLSPADAYGEVNENMIFPIKKANIPNEIQIAMGMQLNAQTNQGQPIQVTVVDIQDDQIMVDANHPLAGKELIFELKLVEVTPGEEAENKPPLFD